MKMFVRTTLLFCLFLLASNPVTADRPNSSVENLRQRATMIVTGKVKCVYSSTTKDANWETTKYVAEIVVEDCEKGDTKAGALVYARYHHKKWIGSGRIPPSYGGLKTQPAVGQSIRIYLTTESDESLDREADGGWNVCGPNGVEVLKGK